MRRYIYFLYLIIPLSNLIFPMEQKPHSFGYWIGIPEYSQLTFPGYCAPELLPQVCRITYGHYTTHPEALGLEQPSRPQTPGKLNPLNQNPNEHIPCDTIAQHLQISAIPAVIQPQNEFMQNTSDGAIQAYHAWIGVPEYSRLTFPGYCPPETLPLVCRIIYGYYTTHPAHSADHQPSRTYSPLQLNQLSHNPTEHMPSEAVVHRLQKSAIGAIVQPLVKVIQTPVPHSIKKDDPDSKLDETASQLNQESTIIPFPPPLPLEIMASTPDLHSHDKRKTSQDDQPQTCLESCFTVKKKEYIKQNL